VTNPFSRAALWAQAATPAQTLPRLSELAPSVLHALGPLGLTWAQWLALPVLLAASWALGRILAAVTRGVLQRAARRTVTGWDERWLARVAPAITVLWTMIVFRATMPWLELHDGAAAFVAAVVTALAVIAVFWALWRSIDLFVELIVERAWAADASSRSMMIVGGNLLKTAVVLIGAVTTAATFGYPVTTVVAGLGIGGIAFAFGAQKTVENLFGSIALASDQPLRVGDVVRVEDVTGHVERIGARSTRIRTVDRTVVAIPNGRLADSRIESFAARDRLRLGVTVAVAYGTSETQLRELIDAIEAVMRRHPLIWPDAVVARLANLAPTSIDIEVMCWFQTTDYDVFRTARQDVLLGIVGAVDRAGVRFAHPPLPPPPLSPPAAP
jgi:MscS family membrane protein